MFENSFAAARAGATWRVAAAVALALSGVSVQAAEDSEESAEAITEVVVTGSRIVRRDLDAASPVVTVEEQVFERSSTLAVESVLNQLPQFVPANTQFNTADVFPSATTTPGISTVSLRGLGSNRTLVLVDGRRAQPVNSTLVIDTNSIPSSALESVEIITGGASAVYGADALGGVTNFKLRSNFEGMDLQFRTGITEEGDGRENRVSLLLGSSLADGKGNAMLGMEWTRRGEVLAIDRAFYRNALKDELTGATSNARMTAFQYEPSVTGMSTTSRAAFQAAANSLYPGRPAGYDVPITSTQFVVDNDGTLYKRELRGLGFNGDIVNDPRYKIGTDGQLVQTNLDLRYSSPMERYSLFGKANFKFTEHIEAFSQVNFVNTTNRQVLQPSGAVGGFGVSVPYGTAIYGPSLNVATGATLPEYRAGGLYGLNCPATGGCTRSQAFPVTADLATLLNARGTNVLPTASATTPTPTRTFDPVTGVEIPTQGVNANWLLGITFPFLPPRTIENNTNLYQVLAGLRGDVGIGDWTWEAYASHGSTRTDLDYIGFVSTRRLQAVATAPNFGKGATITGLASTSLSCTSGLPVFGGTISDDCIRAITGNYTDRTRLSQDIVEATAQGGILDLPAGELRGALGLVVRKNDFQYLPDATREVNNIVDAVVGSFGQANVRGATEAREVYGELLVPLLNDVFLAKSLELELGFRYSDYDTAGKTPTWKALASWAPVDWLRFRGGYQLANRAPNINELFLDASSQAVTLNTSDVCRADTNAAHGNRAQNPNRAQVQALCAAIIGNTSSDFSQNPGGYNGGRNDGVMLQITSGNRDLTSEEGKTWTVGAVIRSPFTSPLASGITLSADWYNVRIKDAITQISAQTTYDLCFNRDGASNPSYSLNDPNGVCQNITRDAVSGAALAVNSTYANTGKVNTTGLDLALNWRAALADMGLPSLPGSLGLNVSFNKLFDFEAAEYVGGAVLENAGTLARGGLFNWRAVTTLRYTNSNWDLALNWRRYPPVRSATFVTAPNTTIQGADGYSIFALTGNWDINKWLAVSGGIDNLFNTPPERVGAGQVVNRLAINGGGSIITNGNGSTSANFYDVLGRRYFLNVKLRF
jgi:outer membrane receptor protein involved in Fe transport